MINSEINVLEISFIGSRRVFSSENPSDVAEFLIENGAHHSFRAMDAGYALKLADGTFMNQGTQEFDAWIDSNQPSALQP